MYIIDSSVWVALFLDFDVSHRKAIEIFSALDGKIYLPYSVILEVSTVLAYKHSKKQADEFLEFIVDNEDIILINNEIKGEVDYYKKIKSKISFADSSIIYLAQRFNLYLLTFDKQIISIAKKNN